MALDGLEEKLLQILVGIIPWHSRHLHFLESLHARMAKLILVMPATNATSERSFSALKRAFVPP